jgi:hypothetical protein
MIPENRVRKALLNVEKRQVLSDIDQLNAAILHLLTGGKRNYDAAKDCHDRHQDYGDTSDKILNDLRIRRQTLEERLDFLVAELLILEGPD